MAGASKAKVIDPTLATRMGYRCVGSIRPFDMNDSVSWSDYSDELEVYFSANSLDKESAEVQRSTFCTVIGPSAFRLLPSIIAPDSYKTKSLEELQTALKNHFLPKQSIAVHSHRFFSRLQQPHETANQYVAALRQIAENCEYGNLLERLLCDRFISGVRDKTLQRRLLEDDVYSISSALKKANAFEVALVSSLECKPPVLHEHETNVVRAFRPSNIQNSVQASSNSRKNFVRNQSPRKNDENICSGCGDQHQRRKCPHRQTKCHSCGKTGHIAKVCRSGKSKVVNRIDENAGYICTIHSSATPPAKIRVRINGYSINMEIDTGAAVTIVSKKTYERINQVNPTPLSRYQGLIKGVNGDSISVFGCANVEVCFKRIRINLRLLVASKHVPDLLGRDWFSKLGLFVGGINQLDASGDLSGLLSKYSEVFEEKLGEYTGKPINFDLDPTVRPVFCKPRRIPLGIVSKVDQEIDNLIRDGVFVPVKKSEWATPLVPVIKSDGSIRLCADYKVTVNKALKPHPHPIPIISHLMTSLRDGKVFAKLDLAKAYLQLKVSYESSLAQTVVTHRGNFRVTRLQFGISTAPGEFQAVIDKLFTGLKGVAAYFDDVVVCGSTEAQLAERLDQVLGRLSSVGLRLRSDKCTLLTDKVHFLGFVISANGIQPDQDLCHAIHKTPIPKDKRELQAFLGLLNFYNAFLPHKSTVAAPLHGLLEKNKRWEWSETHSKAFKECKNLLSNKSVLSHFDPITPIVLVCDASPVGVGAVLCHRQFNGQETPIAFFSRSLSKSEKNYAQIDREALAIVSGVRKFHHFLYGFNFEIVTDHKPLLGLFDSTRQTPEVMSPRMLRWSIVLSAYNYRLVHRPGKEISHADALSRLPIQGSSTDSQVNLLEIFLIEDDAKTIVKANEIAKETRHDNELSMVYGYAVNGWPISANVPESLRSYCQHKNVITTYKGCLLFGSRTIIPVKFRQVILRNLHESHPGMTRMKALARNYAWWPTINADVEDFVKSCDACQSNQSLPNATTPLKWSESPTPWHRIHVDFAGPFKGKRFLLIVDSYSKWLEVREVPSINPAQTIKCLRSVFATHGIPTILVSDNDRASFDTPQFSKFCSSNGIQHILTAPYHPSSNGQAERMVQSFKRAMDKALSDCDKDDNEQWSIKISNFLLQQHVTPLSPETVSPSELLFRRRIRTKLDAVNPVLSSSYRNREDEPSRRESFNEKRFSIGDEVYVRNYASGAKWLPGVIVLQRGAVNYDVRLLSGAVTHRHVDQMRKRYTVGRSRNMEQGDPFQTQTVPEVVDAQEPAASVDQSTPTSSIDTVYGSPIYMASTPIRQPPTRQLPPRLARPRVQFSESDDNHEEDSEYLPDDSETDD